VTPVRIAIVDDHRVVARSLKAYLESHVDMLVVGTATSGEELLANLAAWKPAVVIQDLFLPGGIDGVETTRRIRKAAPDAQVVALTASTDEARMAGVLRAGAAGYVRKDADPEILLAAVRAVARGRTFIDPSVAGRFAPVEELTPREIDVVRLLAAGRSNKEIATELEIGDETVKTHVTNVLAKLQADNRAQAVTQALKRGLLNLEEIA
jgi:NarL family two-component system response regulator LiaR